MTRPTIDSDLTRLPEAYRNFAADSRRFIPENRLFADPLRTRAFGIDASVYRLVPKLVIKVRTREEVARLLGLSAKYRLPVTFRAGGTSLSGQAVTDSVLLVLAGGWHRSTVSPDGTAITLEPGLLGSEANAQLQPWSRKIGPDPASLNHAMIGGIAANNSSGMCCGTSDNCYQTVTAMKILFHDGTLLDTADPASREAFRAGHGPLLAEVERIRDEIAADPGLTALITRKFRIKNTTGYGLNAFVDHRDPIGIIQHLMIGSEGTLGFIAEITFRTVIEHPHKSSALICFPDMETACRAVMRLDRDTVAAAELMDRCSLRSVEDKPGMPAFLKTLGEGVTALLLEVRADATRNTAQGGPAPLEELANRVRERLRPIPTVFPISFTAGKAEGEALWNIRKGLFPAVGNVRRPGTSVIIEDVAFPRERLAEATLELRRIMIRHGYDDAIIFGHALDGNLHFVLTPDFTRPDEVRQYERFMAEVCRMVVDTYQGSLKAEHGTGRNMAPFVELEWGATAYRLMRRIKEAFDPLGLLNPGVIINANPTVHLENLKPMPRAHEIVDKCIECGFCEAGCPSRELTASPRQRIAIRRQIIDLDRSGADPDLKRRLEKDYAYWGEQTCATDGLCVTTCPVGINTGEYTKALRAASHGRAGNAIAAAVARHFAAVTAAVRTGLDLGHLLHRMVGSSLLSRLATGARSLSGSLPLWNRWMPRGGRSPSLPRRALPARFPGGPERPRVVYFPACVCRMMGPALHDRDHRPLDQVVLSLLEKAGFEIILPERLDRLCCGMAFESKGFFGAAASKAHELEKALLEATHGGEWPVFCDTSPCLHRMHQTLDPRLALYEPIGFIHDFLMDRLAFTRVAGPVALHLTCSAQRMQLAEKFRVVAGACAERLIVPPRVGCCGFAGNKGFDLPELNASALAHLKPALPSDCRAGYSNSRTCEIGLSEHGGISYQSIVYLVDHCTTPI